MATKKKEIVSWEDKMAAAAKEVTLTERPSSNFISLQSGQMSLGGNPFANNELDCVVLGSMFENVWYESKYDANNITSPNCFALGYDVVDLAPHDNVNDPVNPVCDGCPKGEWGSNPDGGRGKACRQSRRLMVMAADPSTLGDIPNADMAVIRLPVTSVKNWSNYVNKLSAAVQRPPWYVLTNVNVKPDPKTQFKVNFDYLGVVEEVDALTALEKKHDAALAALNTPYDSVAEEVETKDSKKY